MPSLEQARRNLGPFSYMRRTGADALHRALQEIDGNGTGKKNSPQKALRGLKKVVVDHPDLAPARLFFGLALEQAGRRETALKTFEDALGAELDGFDELCMIGDALLEWDLPDRAADAYRQVIALDPHSGEGFWRLGRAEARLGDTTAAMRNLEKATLLQPNLATAHAELARVYHSTNLTDAAINSYRRALELDPGNEEIKLDLDAAIARMVPQWQFAMLNDKRRANAFDKAIRAGVKPGMHVLDIGTGSGLLAMMAARAGARHVTACESVTPMAEVAETVVAMNGFGGIVNIIHAKSTEIGIGARMTEKADLLVAEILDAGLLSEGVLATFDHARHNLLNPGAPIIPAGATVYAMLIESKQIAAERRVGKMAGFDVSQVNTLAPRLYLQTDLGQYDWKPLSRAFAVFDFDFAGGVVPATETDIGVKATETGTCHAIAFWFKLRLDDKTTLSTGPKDPATHWNQAVYAVAPPPQLKKGAKVTVKARHNRNTIFLDLVR